MSTSAPTYSESHNKAVDPAHPTQDPFTSPDESSNVNNCFCCGVFLVPLAALSGLIDQIMRKISRIFRTGNDDTNNKA
ncbi:hypothetical protein [Parasitella parasitica]|uniref:Uncharacterized protein n=1 Tax=Parasitella parasitica TaxID=35722 RepID=A0A0B7NDF6_9FUNG|nr:hypothetical protein [Parasitella parasitica]